MTRIAIATLALMATSVRGEGGELPPIKEVANLKAKASVFEAASRDKPLVLRTEKAAAEHFAEEELAKLKKQADFDKQVVLVFAWKGSGQDQIDAAVLESFPEQIVFTYKAGRTRDLRAHVKVYVLRSNVKWRTK